MKKREGAVKKKIVIHVDLQCGACGTLCHRGESPPRYCSCCGAAYDRYCIRCQKKIDMFFEEWWPGDEECIRTYTPAKKCPHCNAGLEVGLKHGAKDESNYHH